MSRHGENIWKRKDGRWEARYVKGRDPRGKALYASVYAKTYVWLDGSLVEYIRLAFKLPFIVQDLKSREQRKGAVLRKCGDVGTAVDKSVLLRLLTELIGISPLPGTPPAP